MSNTETTLPKPSELYKKHKHEPLKCECKDDKNHITRIEEANGELVVECTKCKRFLKFPTKEETKKSSAKAGSKK